MTPMRQIETARAQWRKQEQSNLEESWTSLNKFDRSQRGRISLDLESKSIVVVVSASSWLLRLLINANCVATLSFLSILIPVFLKLL